MQKEQYGPDAGSGTKTLPFFAKLAIERKLITKEQLDTCIGLVRKSKKIGLETTIKEVLLKQGILSQQQCEELEHLGELAEQGSIFGNYRLLTCLGEGGMGKVYHAVHEFINRPVALKVIRDVRIGEKMDTARFFQEVRALAKLDHPNITRIFDAGRIKQRFFFTMELVDGPSLKEFVNSRKFLAEDEALPIIRQIALALSHAHDNNVVHRDVKPDNIIIDSQNIPKLTDFGLVMHHDEDHLTLTQEGMLVGSYFYLSPEQIDGVRDIDGRADIYSLGATLYYALTGRTLYTGNSPSEILTQHLMGNWKSPRKYNPRVSRKTVSLLKKMLAPKRDNRFLSMDIVVKTIDSTAVLRRRMRNILLAGGLALMLLMLGMIAERLFHMFERLF